MQATYASVVRVLLCTSIVCALQGPKIKAGKPKTKEIPRRESLYRGTECGLSATAPNGGRIVGGDEAKPHSWPWQVFVECRHNRSSRVEAFCGGSIISDEWVITAAHCVYVSNAVMRRNCKVALGKHDITRRESTQVFTKLAYYFVHEDYPYPNSFTNDVALFKLAKPVTFNDNIRPICLPFGLPELPVNKSCYATGWGKTKFVSERLMQLPMVNSPNLESLCSPPASSVICTVNGNPNKGIWLGDSGGPLVCQEDDRKWYLRGVLSGAKPEPDAHATFTKVSSFEKWIMNIISRNRNTTSSR